MHIAPMKKRFVIMGAIFALSAVFVISPTVRAAEDGTDTGLERIAISPTSKPYDLDAGEIRNDQLTVVNDGDTTFDFIVYARPYSVLNESYTADFTKTPPNADAYRWIRFDKTKFTLKPNESTVVKYTVMVPEDAAPGGHYGAIFAETESKEAAANASVTRKKRIGTIIYATVNGEYKREGRVENLTSGFWQTTPPMTVTARITNSGNTDFEAKGSMRVTDLFGRVKYENTLDKRVLPNTTRAIDYQWAESPYFGLFNVTTKVDVLGKVTERQGMILMIPQWAIIALLVLIVGAIGYGAIRLRKSGKRR